MATLTSNPPIASGSSYNYLVDDNNPNIRYEGDWRFSRVSHDNYSLLGLPRYAVDGTVHMYHDPTSNFSFTFRGTFVEVAIFQSSADSVTLCTVDGKVISSGINGCSSSTLEDKTHDLFVSVASEITTKNRFFDYIHYVSSSPNDLGGGRWFGFNDSSVTATSLVNDGRPALAPGGSIDFNFTGSSISIYNQCLNVDSSVPAEGFYTVDGGNQVNFTVENTATDLSTSVFPQIVLQTQVPSGNHHFYLSMEALPTGEPARVPFRGTILVQDSAIGEILETIPAPTSNGSLVQHFSDPGPSTNLGAVIGGTIGAVFLIICVTVFLLLRRRHRSAKGQDMAPVVPFFDRARFRRERAQRSTNEKGVLKNESHSGLRDEPQDSDLSTLELRSPPRIIRMHRDSGQDIMQPDVDAEPQVIDLPPVYDTIVQRSESRTVGKNPEIVLMADGNI